MDNLKNGLDEKGLIDFIKTVLLSGDKPRGKEAETNLYWGIKQYRIHLGLSECEHKNCSRGIENLNELTCLDCGKLVVRGE
ncbi:hypothetical protein [Maribacter sp.]|uniref:hypothetical protein n=1 Tax=Maribacter sp. TaxID=1897614 RepID=UPI0025C0203F|nr:hypothetical protein [Maribacter sp.]